MDPLAAAEEGPREAPYCDSAGRLSTKRSDGASVSDLLDARLNQASQRACGTVDARSRGENRSRVVADDRVRDLHKQQALGWQMADEIESAKQEAGSAAVGWPSCA